MILWPIRLFIVRMSSIFSVSSSKTFWIEFYTPLTSPTMWNIKRPKTTPQYCIQPTDNIHCERSYGWRGLRENDQLFFGIHIFGVCSTRSDDRNTQTRLFHQHTVNPVLVYQKERRSRPAPSSWSIADLDHLHTKANEQGNSFAESSPF